MIYNDESKYTYHQRMINMRFMNLVFQKKFHLLQLNVNYLLCVQYQIYYQFMSQQHTKIRYKAGLQLKIIMSQCTKTNQYQYLQKQCDQYNQSVEKVKRMLNLITQRQNQPHYFSKPLNSKRSFLKLQPNRRLFQKKMSKEGWQKTKQKKTVLARIIQRHNRNHKPSNASSHPSPPINNFKQRFIKSQFRNVLKNDKSLEQLQFDNYIKRATIMSQVINQNIRKEMKVRKQFSRRNTSMI